MPRGLLGMQGGVMDPMHALLERMAAQRAQQPRILGSDLPPLRDGGFPRMAQKRRGSQDEQDELDALLGLFQQMQAAQAPGQPPTGQPQPSQAPGQPPTGQPQPSQPPPGQLPPPPPPPSGQPQTIPTPPPLPQPQPRPPGPLGGIPPGLLGILAGGASALQRGGGGLVERLARGVQTGLPAYLGAKQNERVTQAEFQQQQRQAMQQKTRDAVFEKFQPGPNATREEVNEKLRQMVPYLMYLGDPTARNILDYLKSQEDKAPQVVGADGALVGPDGKLLYKNTKAVDPEIKDLGDAWGRVDPTTGAVMWKVPKGRSPASADALAGIEFQRTFAREQGLADDFDRDTKVAGMGLYILNDTLREAEGAAKKDLAAQTRLLYGFINSMDNSVVREGEVAMVRAAQPYIAQAHVFLSKLQSGDKAFLLPPGFIAQVTDLMTRRRDANRQYIKAQEDKYKQTASRLRVDPSRFSFVETGNSGQSGNSSVLKKWYEDNKLPLPDWLK